MAWDGMLLTWASVVMLSTCSFACLHAFSVRPASAAIASRDAPSLRIVVNDKIIKTERKTYSA